MNRLRVLFVDDEPAVLEALQNLLRKDRNRWDMVFAPGGPQALEQMALAPFDVVISDMRMPGMDGAQLLQKVKELHPSTARIVLSGHAERKAVHAALPVTHQFLSKPCEAQVLRNAIERAFDLQKLLTNEKIREIVGKLDRLPSTPETYWKLTQMAADPNTGLPDVAAVIEADPAMSTKVLQLSNSAYFGVARQVSSVKQAVGYLGIELIRALALTEGIFSAVKIPAIDGFSTEAQRDESVRAACIARSLVDDRSLRDEAFTAALVLDIGKLIFAQGMPSEFGLSIKRTREGIGPCEAMEQACIGVSHADVGAYLLGVWGLPASIVESVANHHTPSNVKDGRLDVLAAVHFASACLEARGQGKDITLENLRLDTEFIERAGFFGLLNEWIDVAKEDLNKA